MVNAVIDESNICSRKPFVLQLGKRAGRTDDERDALPLVQPRCHPFHEIDVCCEDEVHFKKDTLAKEMMCHTIDRPLHEQWSEERDLVHIINNDVELLPTEASEVGEEKAEVEQVASALSNDTDAVDGFFMLSAGERRAIQRHLVSHAGDAREDFMQVDFRTACLRVLDVLPIDYEDPHEDLRLQIDDWRWLGIG